MEKRKFSFEYDVLNIEELNEEEKELIKKAKESRIKAYAPYSGFLVWSALKTYTGDIFTWNNQENANYKWSCSERVALNKASSDWHSNSIKMIAIVWGHKDDLEQCLNIITPCGQCRQDLKEHQDITKQPITILLSNETETRRFNSIDDLLPFAFGPWNLK